MTPLDCDIFCRVVDNFGDVGVCWRLAQQLQHEKNLSVRLWIDDLSALKKLVPDINAALDEQTHQGIRISYWIEPVAYDITADIVIEAFACTLPLDYVHAMETRANKGHWLNLEYLSAESWVDEHHLLPSPHPTLNLTKQFYFPGFTEKTGGLIREQNLLQRRDAFNAQQQADFLMSLGIKNQNDALVILLFSYENAAITGLLSAWARGAWPIMCVVSEGRALKSINAALGKNLIAGDQYRDDALTVHIIPFVPQAEFDKLLWSCDINFVRGEDSFVRAQWAAKPFCWHIYPQEESVHIEKLDAFLDLYLADYQYADANANPIRDFWLAFNTEDALAVKNAWPDFLHCILEHREHAEKWSAQLSRQTDLATQLITLMKTIR